MYDRFANESRPAACSTRSSGHRTLSPTYTFTKDTYLNHCTRVIASYFSIGLTFTQLSYFSMILDHLSNK